MRTSGRRVFFKQRNKRQQDRVINAKLNRLKDAISHLTSEIRSRKEDFQIVQCRCTDPTHERHQNTHCEDRATEPDGYCERCHQAAERQWEEIERNR